ncbi:MAG: hypothetical protein NZO58_03175, partial [Gemmataceae bacterium]|nr:hypothetical protein [Gemmataceae bacterium]
MRRWLKPIVLVVLAVAVCSAAFVRHSAWLGGGELAKAEAELDALGQPWRWDELLAAWQPPPAEQDVRTVVRRVRALLPARFLEGEHFDRIRGLPPPCLLAADDAAALTDTMAGAVQALIEARKLGDMPQGRLQLDWPALPMVAERDDLQHFRQCLALLDYAAIDCVQHGDLDRALADALAMQRLTLALTEEWGIISALVR